MRTIQQILNESQDRGTYAGVRFSKNTTERLRQYGKENNIPCLLKPEYMHSTVLFSRKYLPEYRAQGEIDPPYKGTPKSLEAWPTQDDKRCLVLRYDCQDLVDRHHYLMDQHQATYDFPEYIPHVTLSYDIGSLDVDTLPAIADYVDELQIVEEYKEDLDLNWNVHNNKDEETD